MYEYGTCALEACFDGIDDITTVIHICRGYPVEGYTKTDLESYNRIAPALTGSKINQVSIEMSHQLIGSTLIEAFGGETIIFGLADIRDPVVESVGEIESQIARNFEHTDPARLVVGPDWEVGLLDRAIAQAKLTNLVQAANRVRENI